MQEAKDKKNKKQSISQNERKKRIRDAEKS